MATKKKVKSKAAAGRHEATGVPTDAQLKQALEGRSTTIAPVAALRALSGRHAVATSMLTRLVAAREGDPDLRATAAATLGRRATAAAQRALLEVASDPEVRVARRAIEGLGRVGDEEAYAQLKKLRPRDETLKRTLKASKTLLSYRLGKRTDRLGVPEASEIVTLSSEMRARPFQVAPVDEAALESLKASLDDALPALQRTARGALELDCGAGRYVVVFHRDLARRDGLGRLAAGSMVVGAVLQRDPIDDTVFLDSYLLAHPTRGGHARLYAMRGSGLVTYSGEVEVTADAEARFSVSAMKTRHSQPVALEGRVRGRDLTVTFDRADVARRQAKSQPTPIRPRLITVRR